MTRVKYDDRYAGVLPFKAGYVVTAIEQDALRNAKPVDADERVSERFEVNHRKCTLVRAASKNFGLRRDMVSIGNTSQS